MDNDELYETFSWYGCGIMPEKNPFPYWEFRDSELINMKNPARAVGAEAENKPEEILPEIEPYEPEPEPVDISDMLQEDAGNKDDGFPVIPEYEPEPEPIDISGTEPEKEPDDENPDGDGSGETGAGGTEEPAEPPAEPPVAEPEPLETADEDIPEPEAVKEVDTSNWRFLHITPSQNEMFRHITRAETDMKVAIASIVVGVLLLLGCMFGNILMITFVLASAFMFLYAWRRLKHRVKENSFVSDTKRGYIRLETGNLHCEQGVGDKYEEVHVPVEAINETLAFGSSSGRQLAIGFDKEDGTVLVNGQKMEEDVFEIRGGVYTEQDWYRFVKTFNEVLLPETRFDKTAWDNQKGGTSPVFLLLGLALAVVSIALQALSVFGVIALPAVIFV